jgi:AcrR family transcriptional regulator
VPSKNQSRIPQETGSDLLIQATIKLARERPISKVGLRDIAAEANLQTMHIKRYFGSRNELLLACTDRLMEIITLENIDKPLDEIFVNFSNSKDIELRLRIMNHLLDDGVPVSRFSKSQNIYLQFGERISTVNKVGDHTARAFAYILQLVVQGNLIMGKANGLTPEDQVDIYQLLAALGSSLSAAEKKLNW